MTRVEDVVNHPMLVRQLESDRAWSAYGLCDLSEPYRSRSRFVGAVDGDRVDAALLVFQVSGFTSLIGFGSHDGLRAILASGADLPGDGVFQFREEDVPLLALRWHIASSELMYRMVAESDAIAAPQPPGAAIRRLQPEDEPAMRSLYAGTDEIEYNPHIVFEGIAVGAFADGRLVACSGTHAYSVELDAACIGGVYTHPGFRSRGLAGATTAAVVRELRSLGIRSVALNVKAENSAAIRAYRRIGFEVAMPFVEGRLQPLGPAEDR